MTYASQVTRPVTSQVTCQVTELVASLVTDLVASLITDLVASLITDLVASQVKRLWPFAIASFKNKQEIILWVKLNQRFWWDWKQSLISPVAWIINWVSYSRLCGYGQTMVITNLGSLLVGFWSLQLRPFAPVQSNFGLLYLYPVYSIGLMNPNWNRPHCLSDVKQPC